MVSARRSDRVLTRRPALDDAARRREPRPAATRAPGYEFLSGLVTGTPDANSVSNSPGFKGQGGIARTPARGSWQSDSA